MANNRLYLVAVDDDMQVRETFFLAKHFDGSWELRNFIGTYGEWFYALQDFFDSAFRNNWGVSLKDEWMDIPLPPIHCYNDSYEGDGEWIFVKH